MCRAVVIIATSIHCVSSTCCEFFSPATLYARLLLQRLNIIFPDAKHDGRVANDEVTGTVCREPQMCQAHVSAYYELLCRADLTGRNSGATVFLGVSPYR
jgi:hypothetical protein